MSAHQDIEGNLLMSGCKESDRPGIPGKKLQLPKIEGLFHLPLDEAAIQIEVSATTLKCACRGLGVTSWPRHLSCQTKQPTNSDIVPTVEAPEVAAQGCTNTIWTALTETGTLVVGLTEHQGQKGRSPELKLQLRTGVSTESDQEYHNFQAGLEGFPTSYTACNEAQATPTAPTLLPCTIPPRLPHQAPLHHQGFSSSDTLLANAGSNCVPQQTVPSGQPVLDPCEGWQDLKIDPSLDIGALSQTWADEMFENDWIHNSQQLQQQRLAPHPTAMLYPASTKATIKQAPWPHTGGTPPAVAPLQAEGSCLRQEWNLQQEQWSKFEAAMARAPWPGSLTGAIEFGATWDRA